MADEAPHDLDARDPSGASGEIVRLVVVSTVAVLIFAGGIFWLQHLQAGPPAHEAGTTIQVRLLQSPDPTPLPLAATEPPETVPSNDDFRHPSPDRSEVAPHEDEVAISPTPTVTSVKRPAGPALPLSQNTARHVAPDLAFKFQQALQRHIARFQSYPAAARDRGIGGTVQVVFLLRRDGTILDAWIERTSGQRILDAEAIETVRRAVPMPVIPTELPDQLRILIPVAFAP